MQISNLYLERIKNIKSQYESFLKKNSIINNKVSNYIDIINNLLNEIKVISLDENIDFNNKYITINEKTETIEQLTSSLNDEKNKLVINKNSIISDIELIVTKISKETNEDIVEVKREVFSMLNI